MRAERGAAPYPKGMPRHASRWSTPLALGVSILLAPLAAGAQADVESPAPGETIHRNEGWYRVEPEGTPPEGFVGALEVGASDAAPSAETGDEAPMEARPAPPPARPAAEAPPPVASPCREARARYVRELFRMAGIWDAPWALDLVEALRAPLPTASPWLRFNLFGLVSPGAAEALPPGVDPYRPLAWDRELRHAARALAACHRAAATKP